MNPELLSKKLARAQQRVGILERMIEEKTRELFIANEGLRELIDYQQELQHVIPGALLVVERDQQRIETINESARKLLGVDPDASLEKQDARHYFPAFDDFVEAQEAPGASRHPRETHWHTADGREVPVLVSVRLLPPRAETPAKVVLVGVDLTERKRLEAELRQAQKLESIGQLSAGIAHEINTPMQFIGDNVSFLESAFADLLRVVDAYEAIRLHRGERKAMRDELKEAVEEADLDYLRERAPRAFERTVAGVARVAKIVRGMKVFAHPKDEQSAIDIQDAIETTLTVAHHEYRYVADLETQFTPHLRVVGYAGDLNQVLLNLVVNAAHSMKDRKAKGKLTISTRADNDVVVIAIADTGTGIPEEIQHRIFDPFFTTKEVGRGTGQGLTLAHKVITELHGGRLSFTSKVGEGTTFFIHLPMAGAARGAA